MEDYLGTIKLFAGTIEPENYRFCHGQELNIQANSALFAIIANNFGGDMNKRTFNLPDLRSAEQALHPSLHYIICVNGLFPIWE